MVNVVRRSQVVGLTAMDSATASQFGMVEEVWIDDSGRVVYLAGSEGYVPLNQVSVVGPDAVLTYSCTVHNQPTDLYPLYQKVIRSPLGDTLGQVEDFLFDWQTGDVAAYILSGNIAAPFGGRAVLYPEDIEVIEAEAVVLRQGAEDRLKGESEGLQGFLSEKSQQVKNLVRTIGDRLQSLISPQDRPEVVRVKIKEVSDELSASGQHDKSALQEATEFLQEKWQSLQRSLSRASDRAKQALKSAWK
jgi:uncharacterized protein YrrD